jgi:hypothetical protein
MNIPANDDHIRGSESPAVTLEALRSHLPLTLLMDIVDEQGPDSIAIARSEGGDAGWLSPHP